MGNMGDDFREMRARKKERHEINKERATAALIQAGIRFESKNDGEHLIIGGGAYELWPSSTRWRARGERRIYLGVERLIKRIQRP